MPRVTNLGEEAPALLEVHMIEGEGLCSNIYVLGRQRATVIDTGVGNRQNPVWPQLKEVGVEPQSLESVVITHAHHDHAMGVFLILEKATPMVYVHERDSRYIATSLGNALVRVSEGDVIETELWPLEVIWTPGHTEGGMCLYARERRVLFSGDTVFSEGFFGRFDGESGDRESLVDSLRKLARLRVDYILAGHGAPVLERAEENIRLALRNAELWG